jgi:hypothetical protein
LSDFPGPASFTTATRGEKQNDCCGQLRDLANRGPADEFWNRQAEALRELGYLEDDARSEPER